MSSRALAGAACLACLLAPASAQDGISHAARTWMSAVVTRVSEVMRLDTHAPAAKVRTIEIRIRVGADGSVIGVEVERPTADNLIEKRVKTAIATGGPFAPPPSELLAADGTTELSFPLEIGDVQ